MNQILYDRRGNPAAFVFGSIVHAGDGAPVGQIKNDHVYDMEGKHRGFFDDGIVRTRRGECVLFAKGAKGGPVLPVTRSGLFPKVQNVPGELPVNEVPGARRVKSLNWYKKPVGQFFKGK